MTTSSKTIPAPKIKESLIRLRENIATVIKGKDEVVEQVIVCLIGGGHILIEDLPGVGKTTLAYSLAKSLDCTFSRVQFTSDLLPSDIIGVSIYDEQVKEFIFKKGPIFANVVLADEINRTTPKTQSSLLEVMDRGKVSVDGQTFVVNPPFMVFATQNPVDYEGTFRLPESQMDRFLMRLSMGYPAYADEIEILKSANTSYDTIQAEPVLNRKELMEFQHYVPQVFVEESVLDYILQVVHATRTESEFRCGISTRGSVALRIASQARALFEGRSFVTPEDVREVVLPVCGHRLGLRRQTSDAIEERQTVESILSRILNSISPPR